jgi:hypothetical protein
MPARVASVGDIWAHIAKKTFEVRSLKPALARIKSA